MRTIAIGNNEVEEFLTTVGRDSKWGKRLDGAYSFYDPLGDNHPTMQPLCIGSGVNWAFNYHDESLMGKRVKVVRGDCEVSTPCCLGRIGTITGWYDFVDKSVCGFPLILPASCLHMAVITADNGETFTANTSWCDIIS